MKSEPAVTADTITDVQLRELRDTLRAEAERAADAGVRVNASEPLLACAVALGEGDESTAPERAQARSRCAAMYGARTAPPVWRCVCGLTFDGAEVLSAHARAIAGIVTSGVCDDSGCPYFGDRYHSSSGGCPHPWHGKGRASALEVAAAVYAKENHDPYVHQTRLDLTSAFEAGAGWHRGCASDEVSTAIAMRELAQALLTGWQSRCFDDGAMISPDIEAKARALGLDVDSWERKSP